MQISPLKYSNSYPLLRNNNVKTSKCPEDKGFEQEGIIPATSQYLSFTGGMSLDLSATKKQIDKFGSFPPDIKEEIQKTLDNGNPEDKTLIDIHNEKYKGLLELETLSQIKEAYPEFKDVVSDTKVTYQKNSFMEEAKNGLIKEIDPEQDLSVQLLQLYWGEGFSITDLTEYFGKNIHGVLEKLNIPRVDKIYGKYLKLSDKNYNERFSKELSERKKSAEIARIERQEGVYIPRGPLSEEHKAKISEGLKKYYTENPDKIYEMSERQLKYYEDNPVEKEIFSQVLYRAWAYPEAKNIKKSLKRYMSNKCGENVDIDKLLVTPNNKKLKQYWEANQWAKERFSICMKKSWKKQKELQKFGLIKEPDYIFNILPSPLRRKVVQKLEGKIENPEVCFVFKLSKDSDGYMPNAYDSTEHIRKKNNNLAFRTANEIILDRNDKPVLFRAGVLAVLCGLEDLKSDIFAGKTELKNTYNFLYSKYQEYAKHKIDTKYFSLYDRILVDCMEHREHIEGFKYIARRYDEAYKYCSVNNVKTIYKGLKIFDDDLDYIK